MAAYWTGAYEESAQCARRLLEEGRLPAGEHERVSRNLAFAQDKLTPQPLVDA
ncbi:hypothetical protein [Streptomyces sp. cmx-4-9]|uniref:hypothetical protein n=1 Tax=Streptomyces sp. cmx-4-9 TaxID=2790941 RepID=UPI003980A4D6